MRQATLPEPLCHRPFTARQADQLAVPRRLLGRMVTSGRLLQPFHGAYVVPEIVDTLELRAAAAALVLPEGSALSRESAAWLYGVDARSPGRHRQAPLLECVVPTGTIPVRRPGLRCYAAPLAPRDVTRRAGIRVTTPLRTAVDLLRLSPPFIGLAAADAFTRAGLVQPERLTDALETWAGFRGVATARRLAALTEPLAESAGESWLRLRLEDAGLPRPTAQIPVGGLGTWARFRLDLGWPYCKVAAEYDGEEHHGQADSARDLERRRVIESVFGWTVIVARKEDVLGRSMLLEQTVCGLLGMEPANRRRTW